MRGIVISGGGLPGGSKDAVIESRARKAGLQVVCDDSLPLAFEKTLFVEAGTRVPFHLLNAAWHFLERWDAAVPLWRYGVLAADVGTTGERQATQAVIRDLRVLLHATELLFVRKNEAGQALLAAWLAEEGERRLAFLRALYTVKPRLCVLPATWLLDGAPQAAASRRGAPMHAGRPLVRVELQPGRFVKVHEGDEEKVIAQFQQQKEAGRARR